MTRAYQSHATPWICTGLVAAIVAVLVQVIGRVM